MVTGYGLFQTELGKALAQLIPGFEERNIQRIIIDIQPDAMVAVYFSECMKKEVLDLDWASFLKESRLQTLETNETIPVSEK